jgi:RNA recognition motif-containing protein
MKRIYVGNLPPSADKMALQALFEQYGHVSKAGIICDQETGRQLGFGFVIMRNDRHGEKAIRGLDSCIFGGQRIQVLEAMPPTAKEIPRPPLAGSDKCENPCS